MKTTSVPSLILGLLAGLFRVSQAVSDFNPFMPQGPGNLLNNIQGRRSFALRDTSGEGIFKRQTGCDSGYCEY